MAKIIGGTTTTPMRIPDWNQTNPNKADYIKNKPFEKVDTELDVNSTNPLQNKVVAEAIAELEQDIAVLERSSPTQIVKTYEGKVEDDRRDWIVARFGSPILAGDEVTVSATYTGENATTFDYRAYDAHGQIYVIETEIPFGEDYTFIADRDYAESSFGVGLSAAETGKVLDCKVYVPGELMRDVAHLERVTEKLDEDVSSLSTIVTDIEENNINLYSKPLSALTVGRVYWGEFEPNITTIKCTDYIAVKPGKKYIVYGGHLSEAYLPAFDDNKRYLGPVSCSKTITSWPYDGDCNYVEFTADADTHYIRTNFFADTDPSGKGFYMFCTDDLTAFGATKVLVMGDSISTDYYGNYKKWVTNLVDDLYFTKVNTENDSIHATGFVATYEGNDDFVTRLKAKTNNDEYGAVIVFGGVNDYLKSVSFDTFKTAVNEYFEYLVTNFAGARLCVLLPLMTANGKSTNAAGKTLHDYVDYINSVCDNYCLPRLNLTDQSGFAPFINAFKAKWTLVPAGYTEPDGVHPTEEYERNYLTPMVKDFLDGLL